MIEKLNRALATAVLLLSCLCVAGCKYVVFRNTLTGPTLEATLFVGEWRMIELLGSPPSDPVTFTFVSYDAGFRLRVVQGEKAEDKDISFLRFGDSTIATYKDSFGGWSHYRLELRDNGRQLAIQSPNFEVFRQAVLSGALPGSIKQLDLDEDDLVVVEASASTLSQYIAENPGAFADAFMLLERSQVQPPEPSQLEEQVVDSK